MSSIFIPLDPIKFFVSERAALKGAWYSFLVKRRALLLDWGNCPFHKCSIQSQLITQFGLLL